MAHTQNPQTTTVPVASTNITLACMPSPHGKDALQFCGKDIVDFLTEFEYFAGHANLTDQKKCKEIWIYFACKEKWVLDVLEGYKKSDWDDLKSQLKSLYTLSAEKKTYQPRDIQKFMAKKRKIVKLIHFDTYGCQLLVISSSLEARKALSEYDRDDYFWSGIQPKYLCDTLETELRNQHLWNDLTMPPPMAKVIE